MIVLGTLFVYIYELSDGSMLGRDQTMVSLDSYPLSILIDFECSVGRRLLASSSSTSHLPCKIVDWAVDFSKMACCC